MTFSRSQKPPNLAKTSFRRLVRRFFVIFFQFQIKKNDTETTSRTCLSSLNNWKKNYLSKKKILKKTAGAITLYQLDGQFLCKKKNVPFLVQAILYIIKYSIKKKKKKILLLFSCFYFFFNSMFPIMLIN